MKKCPGCGKRLDEVGVDVVLCSYTKSWRRGCSLHICYGHFLSYRLLIESVKRYEH